MQIVSMTGLSYPAVRSCIDLFEAGGWLAIRPALRGRRRGVGRTLNQTQEENFQRSVGKYLKRWGFTPQKPIKRAYEQNPGAVQAWLQ